MKNKQQTKKKSKFLLTTRKLYRYLNKNVEFSC